MRRWKMCSRCGVKMILDIFEEELQIYKCPSCKRVEMDISGSLLIRVEEVSKITKTSIEDLINNAIKRYEGNDNEDN